MEARWPFRFGACGTAAIALTMLALPHSAAVAAPNAAANSFKVEVLISDGSQESTNEDATLKNGWGIAASDTGPWWVSVNQMNLAAVYDGAGNVQNLHVVVDGGPTGVVHSSGDGFLVTDGTVTAPAVFLFATESGTIAAWNPTVGPPPPSGQAYVVVDRSSAGAIYKGLAIAATVDGARIYAADFHNARVDVFSSTYSPVPLPGAFIDPKLPAGYAPFGIQTLLGRVFVTFAKQDATATDNVRGNSLGLVDVFDTNGVFISRVAQNGQLNAPWGLAIAPATFGAFAGDLLVGNFGDGSILAFNLSNDMLKSTPAGTLRDASGKTLTIDGLWGIAFGNGTMSGATDALYFAAGPADESHGAFGRITVAPKP